MEDLAIAIEAMDSELGEYIFDGILRLIIAFAYKGVNSLILDDKLEADLIQYIPRTDERRYWHLMYRGTADGFSPHMFHSLVDWYGDTLTLASLENSDLVLGGYACRDWISGLMSNSKWYITDLDYFPTLGELRRILPGTIQDYNSFIFTRPTPEAKLQVHKATQTIGTHHLEVHESKGPSFGDALRLMCNKDDVKQGTSRRGTAFEGTNHKDFSLTNEHSFTVSEIEVFFFGFDK